jgi:hypothetical protein
VPDVGAGEAWIAGFLVAPGTNDPIEGAPIVRTIDKGQAAVPAANRDRELLVFIASRTGMMVKRPALGAEGFVVNHYDRAALDRYLEAVGRPLLSAFSGGKGPDAVFCDSLEVYGSDWTPAFLEEFQRRRGYDLVPHLPALVGDATPATAAIRHDWGQTLTELVGDEFLAPLRAWVDSRGTKLRAQVYGIPPASVSSSALVDLPEGEGAQWRDLRATRWAASASHVGGVPVTSSEAWTWLRSPAFMASPLDMKAEADRHFLQGVNQLIGHGWPYTSADADYPGWRFYAAGVFSDRNPWWIVMPDLARSFQRLSFVLRQGTPQIDVALLLPVHDAWSAFAPGKVHLIEELKARVGPDVIPAILDAGYNVDFVDPMMLSSTAAVEGRLLEVGAQRYSVIVLPNVERLAPATLRLLDRFAQAGGSVIAVGSTPTLAPGLLASAAERDEVHTIAERLFGHAATGLAVASADALGPALAKAIAPDAAFSPATPAISAVHRHLDAAEIYFVANTANVPHAVSGTFRTTRPHAEWWDPQTGAAMPLAVRREPDGRRTVALTFAPYASGLVVFSDEMGSSKARTRRRKRREPLDLSTGWTLTFEGDSSAMPLDRLRSWIEIPERRGYSGVATYERNVTLSPADLAAGRIVIDFGEGTPIAETPLKNGTRAWLDAPVRDAAVVYVNGVRAGSTWAPPYRVALDRHLVAGTNRLRIDVGNSAINAMAARALPDYRLLGLRFGVRFEPQDMDQVRPMPSGLLGPIRLVWE